MGCAGGAGRRRSFVQDDFLGDPRSEAVDVGDDQLLALAGPIEDLMPVRLDHVHRLLRRADSFMQQSRALGIDDRISGALKNSDRTYDVGQTPFQFIDETPELMEAAHRHVAIIDLRVFGFERSKRHKALFRICPFGELIDPMHDWYESKGAVAEFQWR